jgi:hypothetical protein
LFVDRVLAGPLPLDAYANGEFAALAAWGRSPLRADVQRSADSVEIVSQPVGTEGGEGLIEKRIRFTTDGALAVTYRWDPAAFPPGALFAPEISLSRPLDIRYTPPPTCGRSRSYRVEIRARPEDGAGPIRHAAVARLARRSTGRG